MTTTSTPAASATRAYTRGKHRVGRLMERLPGLLRDSEKPVALTASVFLLSFVRWFDVPSPFAAALLAALPQAPAPLSLMGLGAALALRLLWGLDADVWQFAGCLALWLIRRRVQPRVGLEAAALSGLAMLPRAVAALATSDTLTGLSCLAAVPLGMLAAWCLRCGMLAMRTMGAPACGRERACLLLLALLVVGALGYFRVERVNLGQVAAVLCTAAFASVNGPLYGASGGLMCGFALSLGGHDSRMTLALGLCGLMCGFAPVAKRRWLCVPLCVLSSMLGLYVTALLNPPLDYVAAGLGGLAWALLPRALRERMQAVCEGTAHKAQSMESAFVTQRIDHMRQAVHDLACALPKHEPTKLSAGEELGEALCESCANREPCWGKARARTTRLLNLLMERAQGDEPLDEEHLPELAEQGCLCADRVDELARDVLAERQRRETARRKAAYEREITLTHLAALSGTLGELRHLAAGESFNDMQAAHIISMSMEMLKVPARLLYARRVDGHLQVALESESLLPMQRALDALLKELAARELLFLSISRSGHGRVELEETPVYSASVGMASLSAERGEQGEGVCGDACSARRCEGGRLLMMLCDGMGHGEAAHRQSEKTLELLLLLLQAGYTRHQAITAVNGIMLGEQEDERFSTVDLADVNLWTGEVNSEKLGACASWLVRGNHMKKLEGSALPLGIMEEATPTVSQYRLHSGDILVLMSDGVAEAFEDDDQLRRALTESLYIQPQRMADALLRNALLALGDAPRDDMSVMVLLLVDRQGARAA